MKQNVQNKVVDRLFSYPLDCTLKFYREIFSTFSQSNTKLINKPNGQNVVILNVNLSGHIVSTGLQMVKSLLYKPVS